MEAVSRAGAVLSLHAAVDTRLTSSSSGGDGAHFINESFSVCVLRSLLRDPEPGCESQADQEPPPPWVLN